MCHGWSGALFRRRAHQREEIYPIKIPVIRHEVVDMVFICRRGMKRIRKQQSILPGDPERIVQNVRGLKDSEVYCSSTSRVAEYGVSSVGKIAGAA